MSPDPIQIELTSRSPEEAKEADQFQEMVTSSFHKAANALRELGEKLVQMGCNFASVKATLEKLEGKI